MTKIIKLEAENVKRLRAVSIAPNGNVVMVGGKNGAGKTSTLDAIAMALGGGKLAPAEPIRKGQKKAQVVVDLGDLVVTRRFTAKGTSLEVKAKNGGKLASPQKVLDELVGRLTFDPLQFVRMPADKQLATLRELVGLDLSKLDAERKEAYDQRTEVGRQVKSAQARIDAAPFHEGAAEEEVSVTELLEERDKREKHNAEVASHRKRLDDLRARAINIKAEIAALEQKLHAYREELANVTEDGKKLATHVAPLQERNVDEVTARIASAEEDNRKVRENREHIRIVKEWEGLVEQHDGLNAKISDLDERKAMAIAEAQFPVDGLGFGEDGITFNGLPFEQASSAEQLRVSVAIGLALNPKLRVLLIRDGSLLDKDSLKLLAEMADQAEAQVWLEVVGERDGCSVIIEDGEVADKEAVKGAA